MKPPRGLACKLTRYWHYDWPGGEYFTVALYRADVDPHETPQDYEAQFTARVAEVQRELELAARGAPRVAPDGGAGMPDDVIVTLEATLQDGPAGLSVQLRAPATGRSVSLETTADGGSTVWTEAGDPPRRWRVPREEVMVLATIVSYLSGWDVDA